MKTATQQKQSTTQAIPTVQVTQDDLEKIIGLKNLLTVKQRELDTLEESVKNLLNAGATVEPGTHLAELNISSRRYPRWKEEFIGLAEKYIGKGKGDAAALRVLDNTEPVTETKLKVR